LISPSVTSFLLCPQTLQIRVLPLVWEMKIHSHTKITGKVTVLCNFLG
jgi:hypothetical protein